MNAYAIKVLSDKRQQHLNAIGRLIDNGAVKENPIIVKKEKHIRDLNEAIECLKIK